MAAHLEGRAPHGVVGEIIAGGYQAKTADDVAALIKRASWAGDEFVKLVREFRASVPRSEQKQHPSAGPVVDTKRWKRQPSSSELDDTRPLEHALDGVQLAEGEVHPRAVAAPLRAFVSGSVGGYDPAASLLSTMITHNRLGHVRALIDAGMDLRRYHRLACHAGGGLVDHLRCNITAYVWLNQLLAQGVDLPELQLGGVIEQGRERDAKHVLVARATRCLRALWSMHDNHAYQGSVHALASRALARAGAFTREHIRAYVKEHVFPEIYRTAHLCVYNAARHGLAQPAGVEDPSPVSVEGDAACEELIKSMFCEVIVRALRYSCVNARAHGLRVKELFQDPKVNPWAAQCC